MLSLAFYHFQIFCICFLQSLSLFCFFGTIFNVFLYLISYSISCYVDAFDGVEYCINRLFAVPQNKKPPPLPKCSNRISDELCAMLRQGAPGERAQPNARQRSVILNLLAADRERNTNQYIYVCIY